MNQTDISTEDQELTSGFVAESRDLLDDVEPQRIQLQDGADSSGIIKSEIINANFRLFHSMKGSAGSLNLQTLAGMTHEAEELRTMIRKFKLAQSGMNGDVPAELTPEMIHVLQQMLQKRQVGNGSGNGNGAPEKVVHDNDDWGMSDSTPRETDGKTRTINLEDSEFGRY